ncbi:DUF4907 domain-containing protein [Flagellimonas algicola]|uniref:DUF4907 domain-containing protein n=1 Tax=Flagellimonas algicola TaxID=2583815 RepID=A0ABY2WGN3_9FLAO|nr:DUF4907 domain-containing protein [Allomuricauda algicola]TMU50449.1 DUF4907 domain-containing protein [Allomuricauda algicola]
MGKFLRIPLLSVIAFCVYHAFFHKNRLQDGTSLRSEVVRVEEGYGYHIWAGEKLLVKQEFIPAINGAIPFQSYGDAQTISILVASKLKNRISPEVSIEELSKLNIVTLKQ